MFSFVSGEPTHISPDLKFNSNKNPERSESHGGIWLPFGIFFCGSQERKGVDVVATYPVLPAGWSRDSSIGMGMK